MSQSRKRSTVPKRVGVGVLAVLVLVWSALPLLWLFMSAFKPTALIGRSEPVFVFAPTLEHFEKLFVGSNNIWPFVLNSVLVSVVSTVICLILGTLGGYGLAHWQSKGKGQLAFWIISTRMAPIAAVLVPLYVMFRVIGIIGTDTGLIVAYLSFNLPFSVWLMSAFFNDVPESLAEAARVDGCSKWQAFQLVVLPLAIPGVATTGALCMVFSWNDYAFATALASPKSQTLPITAGSLITQGGTDWGQLSAIALVTVVPMIVLGLLVRRYLAEGLSLGAVTGE